MIKKTCFLFLLLCCGLALMAQDFEIVSVESLPLDMSAREEIHTDHNNRQCALLRIATQNIAPNQRELFNFVPDYGSEMVQRATRDGEIWLWVSPGLKYLRVKHRDWGQYELRLIDHVARVESLHTYKIIIKGTMVMALQEQNNNSPTQQYLVFQLSPTNAMLEVNGQLWEVAPDGTAMKFVNFGTYSYRVQAPNYLPETGKVTVDDPNNTKTVNVKLKSDFVEVTLQVDADAEIWVNNEKKGTRTWTGNLGKGNYKIECKQAGYETSMIAKEITADLNGQIINLPKPTPVYGSLNIESTPNFATIYIDGEMVGETPKYISEILVGQHEVKLIKDDYSDYNVTVTINKGEQKTMQATMAKGQAMPIIQTQPSSKENVPEGAINGLFSVSSTKKVYFSKGNLQYQATTKMWRFAERQWDYVGNANEKIYSKYSGWIDMFGWGTSGYDHGAVCFEPWCTNRKDSNYCVYGIATFNLYDQNGQADWGYNAISNGGSTINTWRTLSQPEWDYVFNTRNTGSGIRYVKAQVNNINGVILLPDDWNNTYTLSNTNSYDSPFNSNVINDSQWIALENSGAVFLPAAGYRYDTTIIGVGRYGYYWSATYCGYCDKGDINVAFFEDLAIKTYECSSRFIGRSVRLVKDY